VIPTGWVKGGARPKAAGLYGDLLMQEGRYFSEGGNGPVYFPEGIGHDAASHFTTFWRRAVDMITKQMRSYIEGGAFIRKMFEKGIELKAKYGADAVYDFSLGNPDLPPPPVVAESLRDLACAAQKSFAFGYMPNPGYPSARASLAGHLAKEQAAPVEASDVILSCGAAGALNAFFRATFEPGEEMVCPAPYFVDYGFYLANHGGVLKPVPAKIPDFSLDIEAMAAAVTDKTRAVLINSPNNPTGRVYSRTEIAALAAMLTEKSAGRERPIFLISDEPYRFLAYDGCEVPPILPAYPYSLVVSSFSKNLSLAGERIGYAALSPFMPDRETLMAGLTCANRILGFVNAPAIGQMIMEKALGSGVDISIYEGRRKRMADILTRAGYEFSMPQGAFYFFPKAPGGDDAAFVDRLLDERILGVPGRGFGMPGYFRLALCAGEDVIARSEGGFVRAIRG